MVFVLSGIFIKLYPSLVLLKILFIRHNEKESVSIDRMLSAFVLSKLKKQSLRKHWQSYFHVSFTNPPEFSK
jgi:hypothetical protein